MNDLYHTWLYTSSGLAHFQCGQCDLRQVKHMSPNFSVLRFGCKEHVWSLIQTSEPLLYLSQSLANQMRQRLYAVNLSCVYACPYNYGYLCSGLPPLCLSCMSLLFQPDNPDSQVTMVNAAIFPHTLSRPFFSELLAYHRSVGFLLY